MNINEIKLALTALPYADMHAFATDIAAGLVPPSNQGPGASHTVALAVLNACADKPAPVVDTGPAPIPPSAPSTELPSVNDPVPPAPVLKAPAAEPVPPVPAQDFNA